MEIYVISTYGTGNTSLSAYDNALKNAGILNYNIIPLSSVIPVRATVVRKKKYKLPANQVGFRLYVVMAEARTNLLGTTIGVGLGWYVFDQGGVFVEHSSEGGSPDAVTDELKTSIFTSLADLCRNRNKPFQKSRVQYELAVCPPKPSPRSALTIAIYKAEPW